MSFLDKSQKAYDRGYKDGEKAAVAFSRNEILAELKFVRSAHISQAQYRTQEYLDNQYWFGYRRALLSALSPR